MPVQGAMNNQLLFQMLMAAGQDIGQGNPLGANVSAAFNQNLQSQNYANMLQQLLGQGGTFTANAQGFNIKGPMQALQGGNPMGSGAGLKSLPVKGESGSVGVMQGGANVAPSIAGSIMKGNIGGSAVNPSGSPLGNISASDLAGLTPQDMASALQFRNADRQFQRQSVNDVINNAYKMAQMKQWTTAGTNARMKEMRLLAEAVREAPVSMLDGKKLSMDDYADLDAKTKAYLYYAKDAKRRGDKVISFYEFNNQTTESSAVQMVKMAMEDEDFLDTAIKLKEAGRSQNIVNVGQKAIDKASVQPQVDAMTGDIFKKPEKYLESSEFKQKMFKAERAYRKDPSNIKPEDFRAKTLIKMIANEIESGSKGGVIDDKLTRIDDEGYVIFTVKYPGVDEPQEVRYNVY